MASFYYRAGRADSDAIPFLEKVRERGRQKEKGGKGGVNNCENLRWYFRVRSLVIFADFLRDFFFLSLL